MQHNWQAVHRSQIRHFQHNNFSKFCDYVDEIVQGDHLLYYLLGDGSWKVVCSSPAQVT